MDYLPYILIIIALFLVGMPLSMLLHARRQRGKPAPPYDALLNEAQRQAPVLLFYFYSQQCGPCRSLAPLVDEMAARHGNIIKVDVTEHPTVAQEFSVRATPSFVRVKNGVIDSMQLGALSPKKLEALLVP